MCGLVGMIGDIQKADRNMMQQLLIVDAIRGHHSTGIASVTSKKEIALFKQAQNPVDFLQHKQYDKVVQWDSQVLIGHNRYATVGQINNRTAHPFEFDGIVGAHNGTLTGWRSDLKDSDLFDVDSECLIYNLQQQGWDTTIKKVRGAVAVSVYHEDTHSLCLYRNKERPLHFAYNEAGTVMYWASEAWMLRSIAARCGVKLQKDTFSLREETLVSWKIPRVKSLKLDPPHVRKMEVPVEKKPSPPVTYQARQASPAANVPSKGSSTKKQSGGSGSYTSIRDNITTDPAFNRLGCGDRINFVPVSEEASPTTGAPFLSGILSSDPWCEVRLYIDKYRINDMLDSECEYSGLVASKVVGSMHTDDYVVIQHGNLTKLGSYKADNRDMVPVKKVGVTQVTHVTGPGGGMINRQEFDVLAKHGCGECSCDVDFLDDVTWFAGSPICEDCSIARGN